MCIFNSKLMLNEMDMQQRRKQSVVAEDRRSTENAAKSSI